MTATPNPGQPPQNGKQQDRLGDPASASEIQQRMALLRTGMQYEAAEVTRKAKEVASWKYYVRRFPLACFGASLLAGYMLVPSKKQIVRPSEEQLQELARQQKLQFKPANREKEEKQSLSKKAALMVGTMAARAVMAYVGEKFGEFAAPNQTKRPPHQPPRP